MSLQPRGVIDLPTHENGDFDHGDVHLASGRVFIRPHGQRDCRGGGRERLGHVATIPDCPGASGLLCPDAGGYVFAAARAGAKVLVIDAASAALVREVSVGPRPNGLAFDDRRQHLLVADVQDRQARLIDPETALCLATLELPGRPRWCVYDAVADRFLVNVREPACVVLVAAATGEEAGRWPVSCPGPHGIDLDPDGSRAFVACDLGAVVALDLDSGREVGRVPIGGEPDATWCNSAAGRLYVAVGKPGLVDVVDTRGMVLAERVHMEQGAHTTAFDRQRQRLYVFLPLSCRAAVYEEA